MDYRFLRLFLWVLPLLLAVTPAIGQDVPGDRPVRETDISIDIREESLQDALALLHQLSGCNFLYDQSLVDSVPKITLNMRDASIPLLLPWGGVAQKPDCPAAALPAGRNCRERSLMKTVSHWREPQCFWSAAEIHTP